MGLSPTTITKMVREGLITQRSGPRGQPSLLLESVLEAREQDRRRRAARAAVRAHRKQSTGPPDDVYEWLRSIQVAQQLGISRKRVDQLVLAGRLPFTRVGGLRWFRSDHVEVTANVRRFKSQMAKARRNRKS